MKWSSSPSSSHAGNGSVSNAFLHLPVSTSFLPFLSTINGENSSTTTKRSRVYRQHTSRRHRSTAGFVFGHHPPSFDDTASVFEGAYRATVTVIVITAQQPPTSTTSTLNTPPHTGTFFTEHPTTERKARHART